MATIIGTKIWITRKSQHCMFTVHWDVTNIEWEHLNNSWWSMITPQNTGLRMLCGNNAHIIFQTRHRKLEDSLTSDDVDNFASYMHWLYPNDAANFRTDWRTSLAILWVWLQLNSIGFYIGKCAMFFLKAFSKGCLHSKVAWVVSRARRIFIFSFFLQSFPVHVCH